MNWKVNYPLAQVAVFLWLGFVLAISFMEAWLKFQAPGITVPLGLGIGQLVFGALNVMEWVFALLILGNFFLGKKKLLANNDFYFFVPVVLLLLQTFWLLPALDVRAVALINGEELPASNLHYFYVGFEMVKVVFLGVFGLKLYKRAQ